MSSRVDSLDELHRLISEGRVGQDEALRLIRDWKQAQTEQPPAADTEDLVERICDVVVEKVCELLKVSAADLDVDVDLSEYGLDSIVISQLVNMVNESLGLELVPTVLFEHPTLRAFSTHLADEHGSSLTTRLGLRPPAPVVARPPAPEPAAVPAPAPAAPVPPRVYRQDAEPIAVVGVSGRFPQAEDIDAFWRNLRENGRDCVSEVPADRWDWRAYYGDPLLEPGRTNVKWGGFMDGVADFDPLFFGIAPKDAVHMDPQQRLLMLYVWKALEDAGYAADRLAGRISDCSSAPTTPATACWPTAAAAGARASRLRAASPRSARTG